MLEHLGEGEAAALVMKSLEQTTAAQEMLTPDLGGGGTTREFAESVVRSLRRL